MEMETSEYTDMDKVYTVLEHKNSCKWTHCATLTTHHTLSPHNTCVSGKLT